MHVAHEVFDPLQSANVAMFFAHALHAAKVRHGDPPRFGGTHAGANVLLRFEIDVKSDLFAEFVVGCAPACAARESAREGRLK